MTKKEQDSTMEKKKRNNFFPETKPSFFFFPVFVHYFGAAMKKMANKERDRDFAKRLLFRGSSHLSELVRMFLFEVPRK